MRPRHLLVLVVLAAVPVALALALSGGGGGTPQGAAGISQVSLRFAGAAGRETLQACGTVHRYAVYRAGSRIRFRGSVTTQSGGWTVRLKLKACEGGTFQPAGDIAAKRRGGVEYRGEFVAPTPGYYFARAELQSGGALLAHSSKRYFRVR